MKIWDLLNQEPIYTIYDHEDVINSADVLQKDSLLVTLDAMGVCMIRSLKDDVEDILYQFDVQQEDFARIIFNQQTSNLILIYESRINFIT